jgi:hypothetical protein
MSFQLRYVQEVDGEHEVVVKIRSGVACCCCCCCCLSCWLVWLERRNTKNFLPPFIPRAAKTILAAAPIFRRRARKLLSLTTERLFMPASPPIVCQCGYFWKQWEEVPYWRSRGNATPVFFTVTGNGGGGKGGWGCRFAARPTCFDGSPISSRARGKAGVRRDRSVPGLSYMYFCYVMR